MAHTTGYGKTVFSEKEQPRVRALRQCICGLSLFLGFVFPLQAQRLTLFTENPLAVGNGNLVIGLGTEYLNKNTATPLSAPISFLKILVMRSYVSLGKIVDVVID
ncbi:MAG: hypothetical protein AABZ61_09810 [Bacteroidota bacterium]